MKSFRYKTVSIKNTILSQWNTQILRKHPVTTNKIKHKNIGTYVSQRLVFNWIYNVRYRDFRYIISVYCKKILFHVQLLFSADFSKPRKSSTANNTKHVYYLQSFFFNMAKHETLMQQSTLSDNTQFFLHAKNWSFRVTFCFLISGASFRFFMW